MKNVFRVRRVAMGAVAAFLCVSPLLAAGTDNEPIEDDSSKFFVFHKTGVDQATASADLRHCIDQAEPVMSLRDKMPSGGGLLGALLNVRMAEIDRFRMRNAVMRKCMSLLAYDRYAMPAAEWKTFVNEGDLVLSNKNEIDEETLARQAAFASGPVPTLEKVAP